MKVNKYIGMVMMAAGVLATASCTDFDDYNKAVVDEGMPSSNQTLWQNIQQNAQLSDFAALVKKSGFAENLDATQYYTVWAPVNGTFDASAYEQLGNKALLRQFVQNHIASYGHHATGVLDETNRILMLNKKSYNFTGSQNSYQFDGVNVLQENLSNSNGVMHILDGDVAFYPNLYEYVTDSTLAVGREIDSLRHFFQKYELTYLDEKASVVGPIVDGMQTYVDSVMVTENALWGSLNAKIANEDSTYTFLMPTNKAWSSAHDKIKSYYQYAPETNAQAFVPNTSGGIDISPTPSSITIDNAYWQDSMTTRAITNNLVYSNRNGYNLWLEGSPSATYGVDTLYTTTRTKLSNPTAIIDQTKAKLQMSNGVARIVDSLAFYPWETYAPERSVSAASNSNRARVATGTAKTYSVHLEGVPEQEDFNYVWVQSSGGYSKPELDLYLPNVLSTTYDIYCVFVPPYDAWPTNSEELRPNRVIFTLNYCDATGTLKDYEFLDENPDHIADFQSKFNLTDNATNRTTIRAFSNDPTKLDTLYIGEFTFPVCYYGLGDEYCPNIKITSPFSVFNTSLTAAFSRDMRIASVILKPKELVEFEEESKKK